MNLEPDFFMCIYYDRYISLFLNIKIKRCGNIFLIYFPCKSTVYNSSAVAIHQLHLLVQYVFDVDKAT